MKFTRGFAIFAAAVVVMTARAGNLTLQSPDGRVRLTVAAPAPGATTPPTWSAAFNGTPVLSHCRLGIETEAGGELTAGARLLKHYRSAANHRVPVLFGKADHADDNFHELRLAFESARSRRFDVVFRCYNDAVAFRYELPETNGESQAVVLDESTSFHFEGGPLAYAQYLENYTTSHEHNVTRVGWSQIPAGQLLDLPLTFSWKDGTYAAVTEAALRHYAGMSLMRTTGDPDGALSCRLTPSPGGIKVRGLLPLRTPWRVVLLGSRAGALLESQTLYCLNDPPATQDWSWVKPGKITFSWWNGDVFDGTRGAPVLSMEMAKKYIDFCADNGIPTHSLTSKEGNPIFPWYHQSKAGVAPGPDTDVTTPRADFDLPAIRAYADSRHVRLWTWAHQAALRGRVEEAFTAFEKMGWSGMMVDFFDHDDQASVELAESILDSAARHHLLIHLHGVWKPTGWQRTYPNLMNHEGSLNLEYLKWTNRCTPEHDLLMAFTRLVAGPMDYHLGGFRAVPAAEFKPHYVAPNVLGTRCHQLGMYLCFDNPNPMVADYPTAYLGQPGFEFIQSVPTWWDETRVLAGRPGELLVTARRKGKTWYVGGMAAKGPREVSLPLDFLGRGRFLAKEWRDAPGAETAPNSLTVNTWTCSAKDTLPIHFATDGGYAAQFVPAP